MYILAHTCIFKQMLISIETHLTCDFPGGSEPPIPPLDPHLLLIDKKTDDHLIFSGFNHSK